jgi:deoxyribonuclease V
MRVRSLHPWNLPPKEAIALQKELAARIDVSSDLDVGSMNVIAGVDVSSTRFDKILTAGVVVWDAGTGRILETTAVQEEGMFPYIPGLLSFREIPTLSKAIEALTIVPDAFLVDGHGIAHPRGMGIAAHLGLLINVPTIGVAKSLLCGTYETPSSIGSTSKIQFQKQTIGEAFLTKERSKPIFISPGNGLNQRSALTIVRRCLRGYRLPEPTRLAHLHVNAVRTTGHGLPVSAQPPLL